MPNTIKISIIGLIAFFMSALAAQADQVHERRENTGQVIEYLIEKIASSHLIFIRNDERHSSEEAAEHVRKKYGYFEFRIKSPEDFIRSCASKSLVSGKPYMVVTPRGEVTVESWLGEILAKKRNTQDILEH